MGRNPGNFDPRYWLASGPVSLLSLPSRAVLADLRCAMAAQQSGEVCGTDAQLAKLGRCGVQELWAVIEELRTCAAVRVATCVCTVIRR